MYLFDVDIYIYFSFFFLFFILVLLQLCFLPLWCYARPWLQYHSAPRPPHLFWYAAPHIISAKLDHFPVMS